MRKNLTLILFFIFTVSIFANILIPLEEIKPGMKGIFYSVIENDKIEKFDVEVLKIVKGRAAVKDMIMIKITGEPLKKSGGISEGMSGSPVYIGDRFAGALSYTLDGANDIALVTPAADIIKLSKYDDITYIASGAVDAAIKPGIAIAVTPVKGDITIDVLGTLSYLEGNKVFVMGHPLSGRGNVRYFLTKALIDYNISAKDIPFKIGRGMDTIGIITQDRDAGLSGFITKDIRSCKINLEVKTKIETKKISYDIISDDNTIVEYFQRALEDGIARASDTTGNRISKYYFEVYDETNNLIYKNSDMLYLEEDIIASTAGIISDEILNIVGNPYKKMRLKKINIKLELSENKEIASVKEFSLNKDVFKLGENIEIILSYHVYRRGIYKEKIKIAIPPNFKIGSYYIKIFAGSYGKKNEPEFYDYDSYYSFYRNQYKNNEIIVKIYRKDDIIEMNNFIEYRTLLTNYLIFGNELEGNFTIDSFEATAN